MKWVYDNGQYIQVENYDPRPELTPKQEGLRSLAEDYALAQENLKEAIEKLENRAYIPSSEPEIEYIKNMIGRIVQYNAQLITYDNAYDKLLQSPDNISQLGVNDITDMAFDSISDVTKNPEFLGTFGVKDASKLMKGQLENQKAYVNIPIGQVSTHIKKEVEANKKAIEKMQTQKSIQLVDTKGITLVHNPVNTSGELTGLEVTGKGKTVMPKEPVAKKPTGQMTIKEQLQAAIEQLQIHMVAYDAHKEDVLNNKSYLDDIQADCAKMALLSNLQGTTGRQSNSEISQSTYEKYTGNDYLNELLTSTNFRNAIVHSLDSGKGLNERLSFLVNMSKNYYIRKEDISSSVEMAYTRFDGAKYNLKAKIEELEKKNYTDIDEKSLSDIKYEISEMLATKEIASSLSKIGHQMEYVEFLRYCDFKPSQDRAVKTDLYKALTAGLGKGSQLEEQLDKLKIFSSYSMDSFTFDKNQVLESLEQKYIPVRQEKHEKELQRQRLEKAAKDKELLEKEQIAQAKAAKAKLETAKTNWRDEAQKSIEDLSHQLHATDFIFSRDSKEYKNLVSSIDTLKTQLADKTLMQNRKKLDSVLQRMENVFKAANRYASTHEPIEKKSKRQQVRGRVAKSIQEKTSALLQKGFQYYTDNPAANFQKIAADTQKQLATTLLTGIAKAKGVDTKDAEQLQEYTSPRVVEQFMKSEGFRSLSDSMSTNETLEFVKNPVNIREKLNAVDKREKEFGKKFPQYEKSLKEGMITARITDRIDADIAFYRKDMNGLDQRYISAFFKPLTSEGKLFVNLITLDVAQTIRKNELLHSGLSGVELQNAYDAINERGVGNGKISDQVQAEYYTFISTSYDEQSLAKVFNSKDCADQLSKDYGGFQVREALNKEINYSYDTKMRGLKQDIKSDYMGDNKPDGYHEVLIDQLASILHYEDLYAQIKDGKSGLTREGIKQMKKDDTLRTTPEKLKKDAKDLIKHIGNEGLKTMAKEENFGKKLFEKFSEMKATQVKEKTETKKEKGTAIGK